MPMIVDVHCHVWPDHIAPQVLASRPAALDPVFDGTVGGLIRTMDAAGVDRAVCLGIANTARHVRRVNEFIGSIDRDRLVPFGTVHPDLPVAENLRSLRDNGIGGVKLHPLFQDLSLADPRVVDIARALAEAGIVVVTHAGAGGDEAANERGAPRSLRALHDAVPDLTLVACHYGGYHRLDEAEAEVLGSRIVLETSWPPRLAELDPDRLRAIIRRHGADRIVFGSDWPMADPAAEIATIRSLGLDRAEEEAILGGTLSRLLTGSA
ncbi:amidohydrolase family protein [Phytohabitans sp. ZYX-F-186]|uniref:Amidohydrolase family protein n=1 Tax=Phytohabitans maris TaxID=3071409 RepID=A0ABU0ZGW6_9ACTN|nr:amidohydrolase family protein [Phytohabitans sp. ZYX-F-186]MDQ7906282.1 amidohydrolase family protein [Phytohabitans sp. ZYX-F-186]